MTISIIIPVYNIVSIVEYAINSVLQQTYQDWEAILVDDGSTDGSGDICDRYTETDTRIKVIHKTNGGLSSARNEGVKIAQGDYVLFLDGDDYLHPDALTLLSACVSEHPELDFIQFRYAEVAGYNPHFTPQSITSLEIVTSEERMFHILYEWGGTAASACTKFIKRTLCQEIPFREGILHEDEDFTTRLLSKVHAVVYCPNEFYLYVKRTGSIINTTFTPRRMVAIQVNEERIAYLRSRNYDNLVQLNEAKLFTMLVIMHGKATEAHCVNEKKIIENKVKQIAKRKHLPIFGTLSVIYRAGSLSVYALRIYTHLHNLYVSCKKSS